MRHPLTRFPINLKCTTGKITGIDEPSMNYVNYEEAIVVRYKVELVGWPSGVPFVKPSQIRSVGKLQKLRDALFSKTCYWKSMSAQGYSDYVADLEQRRAGGEQVGTVRKVRSDKNKLRKRKAKDRDNDEQQPKKRRTTTNGKTASKASGSVKSKKQKRHDAIDQLPPSASFKSREFVSDSEEGTEEEDYDGGEKDNA